MEAAKVKLLKVGVPEIDELEVLKVTVPPDGVNVPDALNAAPTVKVCVPVVTLPLMVKLL